MVKNDPKHFLNVASAYRFLIDPFVLPWKGVSVFQKALRYLYAHHFIYGGGTIICWQRSKRSRNLFLLLRRAKPWDDWTFPKGGLQDDETPEQGALRECFEESGIRCKLIYKTVPNIYTYFNDFTHLKITNTVNYYLAISSSNKVTFVHADEDEQKEFIDFRWVPIDLAVKMVKHETERKMLKEVKNYLKI